MNENQKFQVNQQIMMAKEAIKSDVDVKNALQEAQDAVFRALELLTDGMRPLAMLKVSNETIAAGAINQIFENLSTLLDESN